MIEILVQQLPNGQWTAGIEGEVYACETHARARAEQYVLYRSGFYGYVPDWVKEHEGWPIEDGCPNACSELTTAACVE